VRVPLPAAAAAGKPGLLLDVRFTLPAGRGGAGVITVPPPRVLNAEYRTPARWQVVAPPDGVLLTAGRDLAADFRWSWRGVGFAPTAATTPEELDHWLTAGGEAEADPAGPTADALTARQPELAAARLVRLPRLAWTAGCSVVAFALGLLLARLRPALVGPVLGGLGGVGAVGAAGWPHAAAQAVAGAQPGLAALLVSLGGLAAARAYHRWQAGRVPGFTRVLPPEPPPEPAPRSSKTGSAVVPFGQASGSGTAPHPPLNPIGS
jgi:hypothetical protein